jgi:hypothetical protein
LLLYCDHYFEPGNGQNPELMAARAAQPVALSAAGYSGVELLLDSNRMALYAAIPWPGAVTGEPQTAPFLR